jgi:hypothetical protein
MALEVGAGSCYTDLLDVSEKRDPIQVEPVILCHGDPSCVA